MREGEGEIPQKETRNTKFKPIKTIPGILCLRFSWVWLGWGAVVSASGVAPGQELGRLQRPHLGSLGGTAWSWGIPELPRNGEFAQHYFYGLDYCKINRGWLSSEGFHSQCQGFISLFKALTNTLYNESNPCHFWNFMTVRTLHNAVFLPLLLYKAYGAPLKCISFLQLLEAHLSSLHWLSCCL